MRNLSLAFGAILVLSLSRPADAQVFIRSGAAVWPVGEVVATPTALSMESYVIPYSYWGAYPLAPARGYVGWGANDGFAFYGNVYGRPYDLWTWPYMSESYYGGRMARYYYPPVR